MQYLNVRLLIGILTEILMGEEVQLDNFQVGENELQIKKHRPPKYIFP